MDDINSFIKAVVKGKESVIEPATPEELRIIASAFDILIYCCENKVDFPCKDGKGKEEYKEMRDALRALADKIEKEEKS